MRDQEIRALEMEDTIR